MTTIDIIVTKSPALAAYAVEIGIASPSTPVTDRADREVIRDKHVLGALPAHLAVSAASVTEIPYRGDIDAADLDMLRKRAGKPVTYRTAPGRAMSPTREPVDGHPRDEWLTGGDTSYRGDWHLHLRDLTHRSTPRVDYDTSALRVYRDGGSWIIIGRALLDPDALDRGELVEGRKTWRMIADERRAEGREPQALQCERYLSEDEGRREPEILPVAIVAEVRWTDDGVQQEAPMLFIRSGPGGEMRAFRGQWRVLSGRGQPLRQCAALMYWRPVPMPAEPTELQAHALATI